MNAALIVTASDVTISGVTFVGPTDNPIRSVSRKIAVGAIRSDGYRLRVVGCHSTTLINGRYGSGVAAVRWWIVAPHRARGAGYGYGIWQVPFSDTTTATISGASSTDAGCLGWRRARLLFP